MSGVLAGSLSYGERRQLELAMVLAAQPGCCCWTNQWQA